MLIGLGSDPPAPLPVIPEVNPVSTNCIEGYYQETSGGPCVPEVGLCSPTNENLLVAGTTSLGALVYWKLAKKPKAAWAALAALGGLVAGEMLVVMHEFQPRPSGCHWHNSTPTCPPGQKSDPTGVCVPR